jgi:glucose/arabinose dehydrogenase
VITTLSLALAALAAGASLDVPVESDYYRLLPLTPDDIVLEVGGLAILPDGRPLVCTRMGEVYVVENAYSDPPEKVFYRKAFEGLQEPLGLLVHPDGWIYVTQRGELSRLRDTDGDGDFDELETVNDGWRVGGNYHEYNYGPRLGPDGELWITTNRPFGDQPFGAQKWRGFAMRITPDGRMLPTACGLRSPAGIEVSPWGDAFYTDNQGEWCGASKLSLLLPGSFHGHPLGIGSCNDELWPYGHPGEIPNRVPMGEVAEQVPSFMMPTIWFPRDKLGRSPAGFAWDTTEGGFGPFAGQVFVTDQYEATVMRCSLELVNGHWQGAAYPFRRRLGCGAVRLAFAGDGSMFVGGTDRGWGSIGTNGKGYALERLVWTGETPFEILTMEVRRDGFELRFTAPVDAVSAADPASYGLTSYTYLLHSDYGSPEVQQGRHEFTVKVAEDRRSVRLLVDGLRPGFVHELHADGLRCADGRPLLHPRAYYTLVELPAL